MLVDDSPIIRGMNARILDKMPSVEIVASVSNGQMAVKRMEQGGIDVIVLDIEMPVMDGLTAIPLLLERDKNVKILMSSTLTQHGAEVSMRALQLGAADFIPKPTNIASVDGRNAIDDYRRDIVEKILALGDTVAKRKGRTPAAPVAQVKAVGKDPSTIYTGVRTAPKILALGSSTGGPQALMQVFRNLDAPLACPVLVTQHMPPHFTQTLAKHIGDVAKMPSREAVDGEIIEPGRVYIAPGDYHMTVKTDGAKVRIALNQDPAENYCRPAVDPMFRSIADVYGKNALCVVLTGMGRDGAAGAKVAAEAGAVVVAQDEETSVVWGMPGATYATGICDAVLPIKEVAPFINKALKVASHGAR
ncbi:MAG: chemotaxis-specific protein-glutamate methyltransferase CheB [Rhodospirillales bacterium]|nr:chemotaxis-specific protein-glutamate methyltransferase CheB [Rhodospirillales bacterium]